MHLREEPFLKSLLGELQSLPGVGDVGDHLALGGQVGGSVAQAQAGLQRVEGGLQQGLLLQLGGLVLAAVVTELLQFALYTRERVVCSTVLQPWGGAADPF